MRRSTLMRTGASTVATILALAGFLSSASHAAGAEPTAPTARELAESVQTQQRLVEMKIAGEPDSAIQVELGLVKVAEGEKVAALAGGTKEGDDITIAVDQNSATLYIDAIYYESQTGRYYVSSNFRWNCNNNCWGSHALLSENIGGIDGYGVRFDRNIVNYGGTVSHCPGPLPANADMGPYYTSCGVVTCGAASNCWDNHSAGASFKYLDKAKDRCVSNGVTCEQYNAFYGYLTFGFKRLSTACTQAFTRMVHTWSSTTISDFGVSSNGWSVTFSGGTSRWQWTSGAARLGCP